MSKKGDTVTGAQGNQIFLPVEKDDDTTDRKVGIVGNDGPTYKNVDDDN